MAASFRGEGAEVVPQSRSPGVGAPGWRSLAKHELLELFSGTPWSIAVTRHLPRDQSPSGENLTLGTRNVA